MHIFNLILTPFIQKLNIITQIQFEPPRGKTNNVVSEQVCHKRACTATEEGYMYKLEILELSRGGSVLSL